MAEIAKSGKPSLATRNPCAANKITGLLAGEALAAGDACTVRADGLVYRASGAAADANAVVRGFAAIDAPAGEAITLYRGVNFSYGAALTPGASYYLSGTVAGGLADATSIGGTEPIAWAIDATRVRLMP